MAKYRPVFTKIWADPDFENYTKDQKLIFLWLITNELTTESGIYPVTEKAISYHTGIDKKTVAKVLDQKFKNVSYDRETSTVFIHNFLRYNKRGNPNLILKSIENDFQNTQTYLWETFKAIYPAYCVNINPNIPISNPIPIPKPNLNIEKSLQSDDKDLKKSSNNSNLPTGVSIALWNDFKKHRVKVKFPMTDKAEELAIGKLEKLKGEGNDPVKVIEQSIFNGWKGLFPLKDQPKDKNSYKSFFGED